MTSKRSIPRGEIVSVIVASHVSARALTRLDQIFRQLDRLAEAGDVSIVRTDPKDALRPPQQKPAADFSGIIRHILDHVEEGEWIDARVLVKRSRLPPRVADRYLQIMAAANFLQEQHVVDDRDSIWFYRLTLYGIQRKHDS